MYNVLIYSRISTSNHQQSHDRQINDLEVLCDNKKWNLIDIIKDTESGTRDPLNRSGINHIIKLIQKNKNIDKLLVTEISRVGRRVIDALKFIDFLHENGISLYIQQLGMETLNDDKKPNFMFKPILVTLASFAEMERELLSERIKSGLNNARIQGKQIGRPKGSLKSNQKFLAEYRKVSHDLDSGLSLRKVSKLNDVSVNTVRKVKMLMKNEIM